MGLSVIGAGFGRTGTESLKNAWELLGFGPCYHMYEVLPHQDRIEAWADIARGQAPEWDDMFDGYNATVDWPGAHYWRELAAYYAQAKIILSVRSSESWIRSMSNTILPIMRGPSEPSLLRTHLFIPQVFEGNIDDDDHIVSVYERHNQAVIDAIPADRLLVYELGSGWEPLCAFLGVDVPDVPYPRGNSSAEFNANMERADPDRYKIDG